ncbi:GHMP kinase [Desulfurococcus amylolyticus 1221n]|uniref:GHMP kinase n=1 Tax=Desulfurococcus amylolyticus (strain DSM 18924 / JCM 16383 / VKM B-2413 / 1221n) TaxID=490899 RepID=B8D2K4_DESA1|nr:galactokinase family protein [Desulfurococcus amylolyticus]ACL10585.1 GHMP kinase [Desulfurococcus amylolyticus 1221n]
MGLIRITSKFKIQGVSSWRIWEDDFMIDKIGIAFKEFYGEKPSIVVSAPGRLDFLNTHQDYKGLPVSAIGVNLRTYIALAPSNNGVMAYSENLNAVDEFHPEEITLRGGKWFGDYIRAVFKVFTEEGYRIKGFKAYIASNIPIASGLASSAALEVAVAWGISELNGLGLSRKDIAEYAFKAESKVMGIPCGRLDQYGSAFGGVTLIHTRPPYNVEELGFREGVWLVVDSGIRHSTADIHPRVQGEIDRALNELMSIVPPGLKSKLGYRYWEPRWEELTLDELTPYLDNVNRTGARKIEFTIRMHSSTMLAVKALKGFKPTVGEVVEVLGSELAEPEKVRSILSSNTWRLELIGLVMNHQHYLLSKLYDVSLPEIDRIVDEMNKLGALGAKLSGAGLGGSVIALCRDRDTAGKALKGVLDCCAPRGWIVEIDEGVKTHGDR